MTNNRLLILILCFLPSVGHAQERYITLQECLDGSHSSNPDVLNADIDVNSAKALKQEAFASWFPTVSAAAYGFHALNPLVNIGLDDVLGSTDAANNLRYYAETAAGFSGVKTDWSLLRYSYLAALNVTQPIFAGGRISNGNALAALGMKAAGLKRDIAIRDNDDIIVRKYWTAVSLVAKKKALQQGIDLVGSLEKDVRAAFEAGLAKESDLMQVRLKAHEMNATMTKLRSGEKLAKMDLLNASGIDYNILGLDDIHLGDDLESLLPPEEYYRDEHDVACSMDESRLLELNVESKRLEKKMAMGEGLPEIALGASMGYGRIVGDARTNGLVYAAVKIPISDWGKTSRRMQRSQYELEKAENSKEYVGRQLVLKVSKDWIELQNAWDEKLSAEEAFKLAELLESQKRDEYEAGLCTMSELLQCQTELTSAHSTLVDCQAAYCNALSVWKGDCGTGTTL